MKLKPTHLGAVALTCLLGAALVPCAHAASTMSASEQATQKKQVESFVKSALHYLNAQGKDTAFKAFDDHSGAFIKDSSYIYVITYKGDFLATGGNPDMIGKNYIDLKDADGHAITRNLIKVAKSGGGWTAYRWNNPKTQQIECKKSYAVPAGDDTLIGSGFYYAANSKGKC